MNLARSLAIKPKSVIFPYASIKQLENEVFETIASITASTGQIFRNKSNNIYIYITYTDNDNILLKEIKHINKWKNIPY